METTSVAESSEISTSNVLEKREHFKAGVIDFTAGSLGKLLKCDLTSPHFCYRSSECNKITSMAGGIAMRCGIIKL